MQATIQVDLDGSWTYQHYLAKDTNRGEPDSVYTEGLVSFLELFKRYGVKATFFITGIDAQVHVHKSLIRKIQEQGHEIANHTMNHPDNFKGLSQDELEKEISLCEDALKDIICHVPVGFRAPVFSVDKRVVSILTKRKYLYDASILPSFISPLILDIVHSVLRKKPIQMNAGTWLFGFSPLCIYHPDQKFIWKKGDNSIYEVPISVLPYLRLPLHSTYAFIFGRQYFDFSLSLLNKDKADIAYLFHGIDLVDLKKQKLNLPFFKDLKTRTKMCEHIIKTMSSNYKLLTTETLVRKVKQKV